LACNFAVCRLGFFLEAALPEPTFSRCAVSLAQDEGLLFDVAFDDIGPDGDDTGNELKTV